jgi:hypothetical protein
LGAAHELWFMEMHSQVAWINSCRGLRQVVTPAQGIIV